MLTELKKSGTRYNLSARPVDIEDTSYRSDSYFVVKDLPETLTSGKNFFTINGTGNLKKNTQIFLEILDSNNNPLFYDVGKFGNYIYTNTDDLVISPYVYKNDTEWGNGTIYLVGTTIDNKTVRWSSRIKIDPNAENISPVVFYDFPQLDTEETVTPFLNENIIKNQIPITISGSIGSYSIYPKLYSRFLGIDSKEKENFDYRVKYTSSFAIAPQDDNRAFSTKNINTVMQLYINKVSYLLNENIITASVHLTQSFLISNVINDYEVKLDKPFIYTVNGIPQVCSIAEGTFKNTYVYLPYITASIFVSQSIQYPNGDYNPDVFRYQESGSLKSKVFTKKGNLNLILQKINTLTGRVHRYKVYKRGLNEYADFSSVAEGIIGGPELLYDEFSINNFYKNIGEFYNDFHIKNYYYTSSNNIMMEYSSTPNLNTLIVSASASTTDDYIIVKGYTSVVTKQSGSKYVQYDVVQQTDKRGAAYDSNFVKLYPNVNYTFNSNVTLAESFLTNEDATLEFYLTGSYNVPVLAHSGDTNYIEGKGLKIAEYTLPAGKKNVNFLRNNTTFIFSAVNTYIGTLVIIPTNLKTFKISNMSLRPHTDFGYSPDISIVKIPYDVNIKNEAQQFLVELFDYNLNSTGKQIEKVVNLDKDGDTLSRIGDAILFESDPVFQSSPASEFTAGAASRLEDIYSNGARSGSNISIFINDVGYLTSASMSSSVNVSSSWALSASYAMTASYTYHKTWSEL